jgi:hypothetical protein
MHIFCLNYVQEEHQFGIEQRTTSRIQCTDLEINYTIQLDAITNVYRTHKF